MKREPGEKRPENLEEATYLKQEAEGYMDNLAYVLNDIENNVGDNGVVDLNRPSNTHRFLETIDEGNQKAQATSISKADALEANLKRIKVYLNYLGETERHLADDLIIRAEIYLAAHEPKEKK